jgi:hypothetical protein
MLFGLLFGLFSLFSSSSSSQMKRTFDVKVNVHRSLHRLHHRYVIVIYDVYESLVC